MSPTRGDSMRIPANSACFAQLRRGISALATPSAFTTPPWVKDAIADYSDEFMHAALVTNFATYAGAMVTTQEVTDAVSGSRAPAQSSSANHRMAPEARREYCPSKEAKYDC
jgi:hypothetical protein